MLDFTASEEELGKPAGADLLQGTLTLPALLYAERNPGDAVVRRLAGGSREEADLCAMAALIRESSVLDEALAALDGYRNAARAALGELPPVPPPRITRSPHRLRNPAPELIRSP